MSEIVRREAAAPTLPEKIEWARTMAESNLLPAQYRKNPANLLYAVEYADALGVSRINAITSIHVIEGKPSASADLIASMIRRAGHKLRVSGDDTYALAQLIRADDPDFTYEARWDTAKARAAGLLGKGVWKSYPGAMLRSRAITEVARMGASDALFGVIYTPEELGAEVSPTGELVHQVTQVQEQSAAGADRVRSVLPQNVGGSEVSPAATSVAEGEAGSSPAGNTSEPSSPESITQAQIRKMGASMRERGLADRDSALAYVAKVIGREVGSRNELTKDEASRVIDDLERQLADGADVVDAEVVEDPPPAPAAAPSSGPPVDAETVWQQILAEGDRQDMGPGDIEQHFSQEMGGLISSDASAAELAAYLQKLEGGAAA